MYRIISGFPGIGKSYMAHHHSTKFSDSDSSEFSWMYEGVRNPNFLEDYFTHIEEIVRSGKIALISSHKEIRDFLISKNIKFVCIHPRLYSKSSIISRIEDRGTPDHLIKVISDNYDSWITDIVDDKRLRKLEVPHGGFLEDVIITYKEIFGFEDD